MRRQERGQSALSIEKNFGGERLRAYGEEIDQIAWQGSKSRPFRLPVSELCFSSHQVCLISLEIVRDAYSPSVHVAQ